MLSASTHKEVSVTDWNTHYELTGHTIIKRILPSSMLKARAIQGRIYQANIDILYDSVVSFRIS